MAVHFERSQPLVDCVAGTRTSAKGMQPMVSVGLPSVDRILGGGLALNSITIIEEDNYSQYSTLLAKCFVADSLDSKHKTIISSPNITTKKSRFIRELPVRTTSQTKDSKSEPNDLRIAWRYKSQPSVDTVWADDTHFDFGQHIGQQAVDSADIQFCSHDLCLNAIASLTSGSKGVTRVVIDGLGSPLSPLSIESLPTMIFQLKRLMRRVANIVCLVTLNTQLVGLSNHSCARSRVHNIADQVLQLIAFDERTLTPYTEYNGLLNLIKLSKLNSFNYYSIPETLDLGFQLKNNSRFLIVDKLCLPPDLSETVSRTTGSGRQTDLEF